jgi:hypothetical protein
MEGRSVSYGTLGFSSIHHSGKLLKWRTLTLWEILGKKAGYYEHPLLTGLYVDFPGRHLFHFWQRQS